MKVDLQSMSSVIERWNTLNARYLQLTEQRDVLNFREEGELRDEMDLIEAGCVGRHTMSGEIETPESVQEMLDNFTGQNLTEFLKRYDDVALTVLRARLSRYIAPTYREICSDIQRKSEGFNEKFREDGTADRDLLVDQHALPFFAELMVRSIGEALGKPQNIYVTANIRSFFVMPLQMVVKQNYCEQLSHSDAGKLLGVYNDSHRYEMEQLVAGRAAPLRDRLYGLGINKPEAINEKFCGAVADTFVEVAQRGPDLAKSILLGQAT